MGDAPAEPNEFEDLLTGLYNRRYWTEHYPGLTRWAMQEQAPLAIAFIQCDTLLEVNARFAHSDGNILLGLIADILNDSALPAENYVPVRYAGDRFGVLMPGLNGKDAVEQLEGVGARVREAPFELPGGAHATTLSVGVAAYPDDTPNAADLLGLAEKSLDLAVRSGRNRVCSPLDLARLALDRQSVHLLFPTSTLFGRQKLLAHLQAGLDGEGRQPVRLVYGPRGSGTSRIIAELHRATKKRLDVCDPILLRCLPFLMAQPFGVLVEGLQLAVSHDPRMREQMLSRLSSGMRAALVRVLPQWSRYSILAQESEEAAVDDPLVQLEEIFACMLLAIGEPPRRRRPALLVEDAQWLDPQTLHVIERVHERCYTVLATRSHDDTAGNNVVLQTTLQRLHDAGAFESHSLEALTVDDVTAWMHEVLPRLDVEPVTAAYVHQRSHGLPLLFEEIVKFLIYSDRVHLVADRVRVQPLGPGLIPANLPELMFGSRHA
ncbi:MAG: GGDEF domain-containing protein, partial [Candidatus Xenobia bacterium]